MRAARIAVILFMISSVIVWVFLALAYWLNMALMQNYQEDIAPRHFAMAPSWLSGLGVLLLLAPEVRNTRGGSILIAVIGACASLIYCWFELWDGVGRGFSWSGLLACSTMAICSWIVAGSLFFLRSTRKQLSLE